LAALHPVGLETLSKPAWYQRRHIGSFATSIVRDGSFGVVKRCINMLYLIRLEQKLGLVEQTATKKTSNVIATGT